MYPIQLNGGKLLHLTLNCVNRNIKNILGIIKITEVSHSRYLFGAKFLYNYNYNCAL